MLTLRDADLEKLLLAVADGDRVSLDDTDTDLFMEMLPLIDDVEEAELESVRIAVDEAMEADEVSLHEPVSVPPPLVRLFAGE